MEMYAHFTLVETNETWYSVAVVVYTVVRQVGLGDEFDLQTVFAGNRSLQCAKTNEIHYWGIYVQGSVHQLAELGRLYRPNLRGRFLATR